MTRPFRVCVVCTGNTCRSPMAEGILQMLAERAGVTGWEIVSGGIAAFDGSPAAVNAIEVASAHGIDISNHQARHFDEDAARLCDVILVHSAEHLGAVASWSPEIATKTFLLKAFPQPGDQGPAYSVSDPIGGDLDRYRNTFMELDEALRRIFPRLREWAEKGGR